MALLSHAPLPPPPLTFISASLICHRRIFSMLFILVCCNFDHVTIYFTARQTSILDKLQSSLFVKQCELMDLKL